jgi:thiol-disulfide isomerase/thioredoxin
MLQRTSIDSLPVEGELPSLERAVTWLNSTSLSAAELRGKVVLVDFWTYTCINWRRTVPYLRAWARKYKDQGLVVIGVHTPEFGFEKDLENVRRAASEENVDYPIAIDSNYTIWDAFNNRYWPALYFIDAQGRIRHQKFGEGDYEQLEAIIQSLLVDAGRNSFEREYVSIDAHGAEAGADWRNLKSAETYVGSGRSETFASVATVLFDRSRVYALPTRLHLNEWALVGAWLIGHESAVLNGPEGEIAYRFHARDVHLVMGPPAGNTSTRFRVLIDGKPPGASHGVDVDANGQGTMNAPRMYQLIRQHLPITDHQIEIKFFEPGVELFVFTFG